MASPLHLIISNLFTGSVVRFHPTVVSAYRFLSTHSNSHCSVKFSKMSLFYNGIFAASKVDLRSYQLFNGFNITSHRSYTGTPAVLDRSSPCRPMSLLPIGSSIKDKFNTFNLEKTESDEAVCVLLYMPEVKKEDVMVYVRHILNTSILAIEGNTNEGSSYLRLMEIPKNVDITSINMEGAMQDGLFKLTLPKLKDKQLKKTSIFSNIIANFKFKLKVRLCASILSVIMMFPRKYIIKEFCPEPFTSFSTYKEETAERLNIRLMTRLEKTEFIRAGVRVSLNMPDQLKTEDIKSYFRHDTLFIEGKTKTNTKKVHYITCIRLPESIHKNRNMIKAEMQEGMYNATLPYRTFDININ